MMHGSLLASGTTASSAAPPLFDVRRHALFLDLDGTLVEIEALPEDVVAGEALRGLLRRLCEAAGGAVALITGRTIADADRILGGAIANIAGVHGLEHRINGKLNRDHTAASHLHAALEDVRELVEAGVLHANIEEKGASVALHYRHAPEIEQDVRACAAQIAARHRLRTLPGKMVIEIVAGAHTKGDAVETFMRAAPFAGRMPVAVGDDVTDEDAFGAAARAGGFAIRVGASRSSSAAYRLETPAAVHAWLAQSLERSA
jgi:trehalose 6-phosphate phosphatase